MASNKAPKRAAQPNDAKAPKTALLDPDVQKDLPLSWGLKRVDWGGDWGWRLLEDDHVVDVHQELASLEGRTLHDLLREQKIKDIPAKHLRRGAATRLAQRGLEEAEVLWELRLKHKRRAWGLVERAVFYFLWWDTKETVCHAPPKGERRR